MALEIAAVKVFAFKRYFMSACPECGDTPVAPLAAEFVADGRIRNLWACEGCGHAFRTSVELDQPQGGMTIRPSRM
jgi:hypothetical protein